MTDRLPVRASLRFLAITALVAVPLACSSGGSSSGTGGSGGHANGGTVGHTGGSGGGAGLGGAAGNAGGAAGGHAGGTAGGGGSVGGAGGRNTGGAGGSTGGTGGGAGTRATGGSGGGSAGAGGSAGGAAGSAGGAAGSVGGAAGHAPGGAAGGSAGAAGNAGAGGAAGGPSLHTSNLIVNGNAEAAVGSVDAQPVTTPGWTVTGDATAMQYDQAGYPSASDPGPTDRGANLFIGGANDALSTLAQTIDVSADAAAIDGGTVTMTLSGWFGGYTDQGDNAVLSATYQDAGGQAIGAAVSVGGVTAADRGSTTGLLSRSTDAAVPSGTRKIAVVLTMTRTDGTANDGYADDLSLVLNTP